jgi:hypothetical protein
VADQRRTRPFHERFGIDVGTDEAQRRFMNRVLNTILDGFSGTEFYDLHRHIAGALGERFRGAAGPRYLENIVSQDFLRCLDVLEALYDFLKLKGRDSSVRQLTMDIDGIIQASETDLGISWQPPIFVPTGAKLLDERLVYDPLHWLDDPKYQSVYDPFKNGLSHFLESQKKPQLLKDVITDMYEAAEALAKIVTGRTNKDLSANRELFISKINASDHYKELLKNYIAYAQTFRHAEDRPGARPIPSRAEVESFMYLTGLFIRLAVQQSE